VDGLISKTAEFWVEFIAVIKESLRTDRPIGSNGNSFLYWIWNLLGDISWNMQHLPFYSMEQMHNVYI
jgi:hypothetical protein